MMAGVVMMMMIMTMRIRTMKAMVMMVMMMMARRMMMVMMVMMMMMAMRIRMMITMMIILTTPRGRPMTRGQNRKRLSRGAGVVHKRHHTCCLTIMLRPHAQCMAEGNTGA